MYDVPHDCNSSYKIFSQTGSSTFEQKQSCSPPSLSAPQLCRDASCRRSFPCTNKLSFCTNQCKIIKFVDGTFVIYLTSEENENEYRNTIAYESEWCSRNDLSQNVGTRKELFLDNRKSQNVKEPVLMNNFLAKIERKYKYLGVMIQAN